MGNISNLSDVLQITNRLLGKYAWKVQLGHGSFITFEFGEKITDGKYVHGEWHLWVYDCAWRVQSDTNTIVGSGDTRTKIASEISRLVNKKILAIDIQPPALETTISFEDGLELRLFPYNTEDADHWYLYTPDGNTLIVGPRDQWTYASSSSSG